MAGGFDCGKWGKERKFLSDGRRRWLVEGLISAIGVAGDDYLNDARNFPEKDPTSTTQSFVSKDGIIADEMEWNQSYFISPQGHWVGEAK